MRAVAALAVLGFLAASPALSRGPRVLRCTDGSRSCDVDRTQNGTCVVNLCERGGCGCALAGCCGARFCPTSTTPLAQVVLVLDGKRKVQQTVAFGTGSVTVRCRKPAPPPSPPSGYQPY